jgi:AhpD family alkylhydroperoxidase
MTKADIIKEIEAKLGAVPGFYKNAPEVALVPLWGLARDAVFAETALPRRIKSLVGLTSAVALQDPYRTYLAHEMANATGVPPEEVNEAIAKTGETVLFSTWINGVQYDYDKFHNEVRTALDHVASQSGVIPPLTTSIDNRRDVIADIQGIFGLAPGFFEQLPDVVLPSAWKLFRGISLSETRLPGKYKELISLGVATALSCKYCTYFHTEAAKLNGASDAEIKETAAFVAQARYFTTVINGQRYDLDQFRKDVRPMVATMRKLAASNR